MQRIVRRSLMNGDNHLFPNTHRWFGMNEWRKRKDSSEENYQTDIGYGRMVSHFISEEIICSFLQANSQSVVWQLTVFLGCVVGDLYRTMSPLIVPSVAGESSRCHNQQ